MNPRLATIKVLQLVINQGNNLPDALKRTSSDNGALTMAMSYGVIRFYQQLDFFASQLLEKPLRKKDQDIQLLILLGIYQLQHMHVPDHAAVSETVKVCKSLKKPWAKNLVNGVLRQFQRQQDKLLAQLGTADDSQRFSHPGWLVEKIKSAWPDDWQPLLTANNTPAPMTLRVNQRKTSRDDYLKQLEQNQLAAEPHPFADHALVLEKALDVDKLPGFDDGLCSVQDAAAQLAASLLAAQPGERILDACAAPGGKTAHILEQQPELENLVALDIDDARLARVKENLARLQLDAQVLQGDAANRDWWDGEAFDRILLDAPCSATGVIRRHPDIKLLRRAEDIDALLITQQQILDQLWPLLKPAGMLIYATCSVLPQENTLQVEQFLTRHPDARLDVIEAQWGRPTSTGRQVLPGEAGMDGFFYARIYKEKQA